MASDTELRYQLPSGQLLTFSEFLTLLCERRAEEAKAEAEVHAVAKNLIEEEQV